MIPAGIPTVLKIVKEGKGGPEKNAIPVREDLGGQNTGYLANESVVRIVNPNYAGIGKYCKLYNNTTWVQFDMGDKDLVPGKDGWCEKTGHLYDYAPTPPVEDIAEVEVVEERITNGRKFLKLKKV